MPHATTCFFTMYLYRKCSCQVTKFTYHKRHMSQIAFLAIIIFIIVAFFENATIEYWLESLCVCVRVCVFLHDNSKRNRSRNMKLEYIVVYGNSSDQFDIEHHQIKVKVTVGL